MHSMSGVRSMGCSESVAMTAERHDKVRKLAGRIAGLRRARRARDFVMEQLGGGIGASAVRQRPLESGASDR
ncbi:hypothetical protein [Achromobacter xylosoxidans]|uniref:hypothetical protein n=2 Tax=Alcaligenes xylosoxydans xylosoxydans TaxID=85698 RepID=UPI00192A733A|nr:hypothetical protein [Achromobacter xylosoxidans]